MGHKVLVTHLNLTLIASFRFANLVLFQLFLIGDSLFSLNPFLPVPCGLIKQRCNLISLQVSVFVI